MIHSLTILLLTLSATAAPALAQSVAFFDDVLPGTPYYNHANLMRIRFVTTGCSFVPSEFCATESLTRGQAAVLIVRSIYSATTGNPEAYTYNQWAPQYFSDVPPSHPQYVYIQKIAELGITSGCGSGAFCPDDFLNYAQVATLAIRARMVRDTGSVFSLDCNAQPGTFAYFDCNAHFWDMNPADFFFPYARKAFELLGNDAKPPGCGSWMFCPATPIQRGYFALYAVRLIMNAASASQLPTGGNLPAVSAPNNWPAGISLSCQPSPPVVATENRFIAVDPSNVYAYAITGFSVMPSSPSLWMSYVSRQLTGPGTPAPSFVDRRLGNATTATLQSATFTVNPGQYYSQNTSHGVISGCISSAPPYIASTQSTPLAIATQTITTSPPGLSLTVDNVWCGTPCTYQWLSGTSHLVSAAMNQNLGGVQYQFSLWSDGGTSTHQYYTPAKNTNLVATYTAGGGPYPVSAVASPVASGTVTPTGGSYAGGTIVTFQATPVSGQVFESWTIFTPWSVTTNNSNPMTLAVNGATRAVASFRGVLTGGASCTASPNPARVGNPVTVTANVSNIGQPSYVWTGAASGSASTATFTPGQPGGYLAKVTINGDTNLTALCMVAVAEPALEAFRNCIGSAGSAEGDTCELAPGLHIVPPQWGHKPSTQMEAVTDHYLKIGRSNMTITGTGVTAADTVLKRGVWYPESLPPPWPPGKIANGRHEYRVEHIMVAPSANTSNVVIRKFLFHGNRYGRELNCMGDPNGEDNHWPFYDLSVSQGGTFTLNDLDFVGSPGTAVHLAGTNSSISGSRFGLGYNPPAGVADEVLAEKRTGARTTSIFLEGNGSMALYNEIQYSGTAAINVAGHGQEIIGNKMRMNRYENPDGSGGGQLYLNGEGSYASSGAIVAANEIDGGLWPPPNSANTVVDTGCRLPLKEQSNNGVEGYGQGHILFNNEIRNHTAAGLQFGGSQPTARIAISSVALFPEDGLQRRIEENTFAGIWFVGYEWCRSQGDPNDPSDPERIKDEDCQATNGTILDALLVSKTIGRSVVLDLHNGLENGVVPVASHPRLTNREVSPPAALAYAGFFNGSCLIDNVAIGGGPGDEPIEPALVPPNPRRPLTRARPFSMTSYIPFGAMSAQSCPAEQWPASLPPSPSYHPRGWPR